MSLMSGLPAGPVLLLGHTCNKVRGLVGPEEPLCQDFTCAGKRQGVEGGTSWQSSLAQGPQGGHGHRADLALDVIWFSMGLCLCLSCLSHPG